MYNQDFEKGLPGQFKKIGQDVITDSKKLFGAPRAVGSPITEEGQYANMPFANLPSAFLESITNPQKAALRNEFYNPSLNDIAVALDKPGAKEGTYDVSQLTTAEKNAAG